MVLAAFRDPGSAAFPLQGVLTFFSGGHSQPTLLSWRVGEGVGAWAEMCKTVGHTAESKAVRRSLATLKLRWRSPQNEPCFWRP